MKKLIKFVICEDDKEALETANKYVVKAMMNYDIEYKILKFTKYNKEFKKIIEDDTDLKVYILDIELPTVSGLEIASEIREIDDESIIIFVTAHSESKNDIFYSRLGAVDFISKYHRYEERLADTIAYVMDRLYKNKVLSFTYNYVQTRLRYREINYIEKAPLQNKCIIHEVNGEQKSIATSIVRLRTKLKPLFFQTHKSCLVNLDNIREIDYSNSIIHFKNGETTNLIAPSARKELKKIVGEF